MASKRPTPTAPSIPSSKRGAKEVREPGIPSEWWQAHLDSRHSEACRPTKETCKIIHSVRLGDLDPSRFGWDDLQARLQPHLNTKEKTMAKDTRRTEGYSPDNELVVKVQIRVTDDYCYVTIAADEHQLWAKTQVWNNRYTRSAGTPAEAIAQRAATKAAEIMLAQLSGLTEEEEL